MLCNRQFYLTTKTIIIMITFWYTEISLGVWQPCNTVYLLVFDSWLRVFLLTKDFFYRSSDFLLIIYTSLIQKIHVQTNLVWIFEEKKI